MSLESARAPKLTDTEVGQLLRTAKAVLADELSRPPGGLLAPRQPERWAHVVNISIFLDGRLRGSMSGQGGTLADAVALGARRAARDTRFGPALGPPEIARATVELWVQHEDKPMSPGAAITRFDLGVDGVQLRRGHASAYYKPSVPLTGGVTEPVQLLRRLVKKAGLEGDAWCYEGTELRCTAWSHYLENPFVSGGISRLHRLRPARTPEPSPTELEQRLTLACDRLLASQLPSGLYLYRYSPFSDHGSGDEVNTVRQAGCTYAMAAAASAEADRARGRRLSASAARSLEYLMNFAASSPRRQTVLVAPHDEMGRQGALGAVALTLLALQFGVFAEKYRSLRADLTETVLDAQEQDGHFRCDLLSDGQGHSSPGQSFYPGEALIALGWEADRGHADCAEALRHAFPWYRAYFRRKADAGFVLWQVDAWRRAHELARKGVLKGPAPDELAAFVFEMVDWVLRYQLPPATEPSDFAGGFSLGGPPGFSTATYVEAVLRAHQLARSLRRWRRAERYRQAAHMALKFLFRLQIVADMTPLLPRPSLAIGATTASLVDFHIRSDFDMHTITALLAAVGSPEPLPAARRRE